MNIMKLLVVLAWLLASPAWGFELVRTQTVTHGVVQPGHSISLFVPFTEQSSLPVVQVLMHTISTTVLYSVEFLGPSSLILRCYNYGIFPQNGRVTLGFWGEPDKLQTREE